MIDSYIINLSICIIEFDSFQNIDLMQFFVSKHYTFYLNIALERD